MPSRSRSAIKKYILANNKTVASNLNVFDSQVNKAIRTGVEKGDFAQPKGKSLVCPMSSPTVFHLHPTVAYS